MSIPSELYTIPECIEVARLPMGGARLPYDDEKPARRCAGGLALSLDGEWRFMLCHTPSEAPADFASCEFNDSQWRMIDVPSHWTLQNTFDRPIYTNSLMPFANCPPDVPVENPTGLYRRYFELPTQLPARIVLQIGGAESYLEVWCNGRFVGMGKDTRLASEFDLTPYIH